MASVLRLVFVLATVIVGFEIALLIFFTGSQSELELAPHGENNAAERARQTIDLSKAGKIQNDKRKKEARKKKAIVRKPWDGTIHISVVICGDRTEEAVTMLKTATLFTKRSLVFHIVAESHLHNSIHDLILKWPVLQHGQVNYKIHPLRFPKTQTKDEWKKLFKPCAAQRLFLPTILKDVDSLLYMDTDTLILAPVDKIWEHFSKFNSSQLAAMAPEGEVPSIGWYNRFARHPYYGKLGMNSGVMLMNLTRMRAMTWLDHVVPIYKKYRFDITWGDQDILNILFHFNPELLYVYNCEWNYRPDHCMYGNSCEAAATNGIAVLHGNRGVFHNDKQPSFKVVYEHLRDFKHGDNMKDTVASLQRKLEQYEKTYCGEIKAATLKYLLQG